MRDAIHSPPVYEGGGTSNSGPPFRFRYCADCVFKQYAMHHRVLRETSHYCPGRDGEGPTLVHWFGA
jgi:hypothetical protein